MYPSNLWGTLGCFMFSFAYELVHVVKFFQQLSTYVDRVLSSAREPSSQHTLRVWGCRFPCRIHYETVKAKQKKSKCTPCKREVQVTSEETSVKQVERIPIYISDIGPPRLPGNRTGPPGRGTLMWTSVKKNRRCRVEGHIPGSRDGAGRTGQRSDLALGVSTWHPAS